MCRTYTLWWCACSLGIIQCVFFFFLPTVWEPHIHQLTALVAFQSKLKDFSQIKTSSIVLPVIHVYLSIFFLISHCIMSECKILVRWNENYILKQTMGDSASMTFRVNHLISSQLLQLHVIYRRGIYKLLN